MQQVLNTRNNEVKRSEGSFGLSKPRRKQVSYGRNEDYIGSYETKLMKRYRIGYSDLIKMLIVKEAERQFHDLTRFI